MKRAAAWVFGLWMTVGLLPPGASAGGPAATGRTSLYDESADGEQQIAAALATAKQENKRVLLQFGANWCGWCHKLHKLFQSDPAIAQRLLEDYIVVLIDVNQGHNEVVNETYGRPTKHGLPVLVVLDADGELMIVQDTGKMENATGGHDPAQFLAFLDAWVSPTRP